jgi:hypothetical protein
MKPDKPRHDTRADNSPAARWYTLPLLCILIPLPASCASFEPMPLQEETFSHNIHTRTEDDIWPFPW